jgi:hypothetical protein
MFAGDNENNTSKAVVRNCVYDEENPPSCLPESTSGSENLDHGVSLVPSEIVSALTSRSYESDGIEQSSLLGETNVLESSSTRNRGRDRDHLSVKQHSNRRHSPGIPDHQCRIFAEEAKTEEREIKVEELSTPQEAKKGDTHIEHPLFAEEVDDEEKEEKLEEISTPQEAKKSDTHVEKNRILVGETKVEKWDATSEEFAIHQEAKHTTTPIDLEHSSHLSIPVSPVEVSSEHRQVIFTLPQQVRPGAFAIGGPGFREPHDSFSFVVIPPSQTDHGESQEEMTTTLNATLVDDTTLASATVVDMKAEEQAQRQRRMRAYLVSFMLTSILVAVIAVVVVKTGPKPKFVITLAPTTSFIPSLAPSGSPSAVPSYFPSGAPSATPSTSLFGFLAQNSFDSGLSLTTTGTSQQRAMQWLETELFDRSMDYTLLQYYVLVVLYYETFGSQWYSTISFSDSLFPDQWLGKDLSQLYNLCDWKGVHCNGTFITSLQLSGNGLIGSSPPEIAALDQSLSKISFATLLC